MLLDQKFKRLAQKREESNRKVNDLTNKVKDLIKEKEMKKEEIIKKAIKEVLGEETIESLRLELQDDLTDLINNVLEYDSDSAEEPTMQTLEKLRAQGYDFNFTINVEVRPQDEW